MKYYMAAASSLAAVDKVPLRTKDAFFKLDKSTNAEVSELFPRRMRGLSSYDVLDSQDFDYAKKVEARLQRFERRNRIRVIKAAAEQRAATTQELKTK